MKFYITRNGQVVRRYEDVYAAQRDLPIWQSSSPGDDFRIGFE